MDNRLRLHATAGFAVLSISTAMTLSAAPQASATPVNPDSTQLVGAAQTLSRGPATTTLSPPGLIGQQIAFNVAFATDFLSTGADLFGREFAIPGTLAAEIAGGTPPPAAIGHALRTFADVEVDAGVALVRFGHEYVRFQRQFVTGIISGQSATASNVVRSPASAVLRSRSGLRDQAAGTGTVRPVRPSGHNDLRVLRHHERRGEGLLHRHHD